MSHSFRIGEWRVESHQNELVGTAGRVKLEPRLMELLVHLAEYPGKVISRERLLEAIWQEDVVSDEVLTVAVSELRKVLGDDPKRPRFIQTLPRKGYRLLPTPMPVTDRTSPARAAAIGLGASLFLALVVGYGWYGRHEAAGVRPDSIRSLVVLPLRNLSGDPEQEYFADGMTEALTTDLAKIRELKVISRTSAMRYKNREASIVEIGRVLDVDAVIEGSVLRDGTRVRITAQLIHAASDQHLWAESYEREHRDVLALQGEIARTIARELRLELTQDERARLTSSTTVNPAIHESYLKGVFYCNKFTTDGIETGIKLLKEAVAVDPGYAPAFASLSRCYRFLAYVSTSPPTELFPKAKAAATKALELEESLAAAHIELALVKFSFEWDWSGAEAEFQRALELDPGSSVALGGYGFFLSTMGRHDEAIRESRRAHTLDPLSPFAHQNVAQVLYFARRYDEAIETLEELVDVNPNLWFAYGPLGRFYATMGRYPEAIEAYQKVMRLTGGGDPMRKGMLAYVYAVSGEINEAQRILHEMEELSKRRYVPPAAMVMIFLGLGETDSVFAWAERSYQVRDAEMVAIRVHPLLDPIRSDPRFQDLLRRLNFPE